MSLKNFGNTKKANSYRETQKKNKGFESEKKKKRKVKKKKDIKRNKRLEKLSNTPKDATMEFLSRKEKKEFLSTAVMMDVKGIAYNTRNYPLVMANGYSKYMQILEIRGKDLYKLSPEERKRTINNFSYWLNAMTMDLTFETTKLPTDTSSQVSENKRLLKIIQNELSDPTLSGKYRNQLLERSVILENQIMAEEAVKHHLYNTEYLLFLFDNTTEGLQQQLDKAIGAGNNDFVPKLVPLEKKIQIYKQFNNQNEKI